MHLTAFADSVSGSMCIGRDRAGNRHSSQFLSEIRNN